MTDDLKDHAAMKARAFIATIREQRPAIATQICGEMVMAAGGEECPPFTDDQQIGFIEQALDDAVDETLNRVAALLAVPEGAPREEGENARCQWCGLEDHAGNCPVRRVQALENGAAYKREKMLRIAAEAEVQRLREALQDARSHLAVWWREEHRCPCGARPESPQTHPHVISCPTAAALTAGQEPRQP